MNITSLPSVVQDNIFDHLSSSCLLKTWKQGSFFPPSQFQGKADSDVIANQLKFCIIFPEFTKKLEYDLDQELY